MYNVKVTTAKGGVYTIYEASMFGPDAILGHTKSDPTLRLFKIEETDELEEI